MKKFLSIIILFALVFSLIGCDSNESNNDSGVDYDNAESFESALNDGANVKGKTVQFYVKEYAPDSILGINCHAGEHLNFLFEDELDIKTGDTIIVRVNKEPSKVFLLGSWKISCELLEVCEYQEDENDTSSETISENDNIENEEIAVTMSADDFEGMNYKDAEKKLREMGFTKFDYDTIKTENESLADTISYINITEFLFGDTDFEKGDKFDFDSTITLCYYKYEEPKKPDPVFYSTNDRETAKKGNTGVFSYKNKSGSYDVYWIIDFDSGYVYNFTEGNGSTTCDKVKIVSGTLNDRITVTWHDDGGNSWSWHLHFKYTSFPETLVVNDHNGFAAEFTTTDLDKALSVRSTKTIINY